MGKYNMKYIKKTYFGHHCIHIDRGTEGTENRCTVEVYVNMSNKRKSGSMHCIFGRVKNK